MRTLPWRFRTLCGRTSWAARVAALKLLFGVDDVLDRVKARSVKTVGGATVRRKSPLHHARGRYLIWNGASHAAPNCASAQGPASQLLPMRISGPFISAGSRIISTSAV
jgi:hypothetical protein